MKSLVVRSKEGTAIYGAGAKYRVKENGESELINQTDEEVEQDLYQSLISDIKRKEFDKTMIALILGYAGWNKDDCENIKLVLTGNKGRYCEMNITVTTDYTKFTSIELPQIENPNP